MGQVLQKAMRIPRFGFAIEEQRKIFSLDQALEALTPAHQSKSTSAAFEDDHIVITKHIIVCPWCGKTAPAYYSRKINPHPLLNVWIEQQISWFDELPSALVFNKPREETSDYICPKCNAISHRSKGFVDVHSPLTKRRLSSPENWNCKTGFKLNGVLITFVLLKPSCMKP